jgi:hypothetical protein
MAWVRRGADRRRRGHFSSPRAPPPLSAPAPIDGRRARRTELPCLREQGRAAKVWQNLSK